VGFWEVSESKFLHVEQNYALDEEMPKFLSIQFAKSFSLHCKKLRDSWISFDQTFLGMGLGKLFPARENMVSDIPAGDGNTAKPFLTAYTTLNPIPFECSSFVFLSAT